MRRLRPDALVGILSLLLVALGGFRGALTTNIPIVQTGVFLDAKIGGGGWLVGADINPTDNTTLARTDSYGAYLLNRSTGTFSQLVTQSSMPAALFGSQVPMTTTQAYENPAGAYEITSAPSNSSIIYIALGMKEGTVGHVLKSTNQGTTWTDTAFSSACTGGCAAMGPNDQARMDGRKMQVDPANPNIVYIGTQLGGVYYSVDGNSFTAQSLIPTVGAGTCTGSGQCHPGYNIAFDTSGGTTTSCAGSATLCTKNIYICAYSHGVYASTDGGQTWNLTTAGPTTCQHMVTAANTGVLLAVDGNAAGNGFYWTLVSGTWTKDPQSLLAHYHSVAADPANCASWATCHVAIGDNGGGLEYTQTAGSSPTWTAMTSTARTCPIGQPPWQCVADQFSLTNGDTIFEASGGVLDLDGGQGFWTTTPTTSPSPALTVTWASLVAGVEQVISGPVIAPNGVMVVGAQDLGVFALSTFPSTYPTFSGNVNTGPSLISGWALDYASTNTSFMVDVNGPEGFGNYDFSGTSSDGGHTWTPFSTYSAIIPASNLVKCTISTNICVNVSSAQAANFTTWAAGSGSIVTLLNVNPTVSEGIPNINNNNFYVTVNPSGECTAPCLKLTSPTITNWLAQYSNTGGSYNFHLSTRAITNFNGSYIIQNVTSNAGVVHLAWTVSTSAQVSDDPVCVNGVTMSGASVVNGCWLLANSSGTVGDLFGSTFVGGDTYVGGGQMLETSPDGGAIAASTTTNFIRIPSNNSYPYCTTDGGLTWTELHAPGAPYYSTIATASWTGSVVTFTTNAAVDISTLASNNTFTVTGSSNTAYNGTYTATGGSGTTVTAALASNPGTWTASNAAVLSPAKTGWPSAYFSPGHVVVADRVTANTFYLYNYLAGIFTVTNCGAPTNVNTGSLANNAAANHKFGVNSSALTTMKSVDGQGGHFLYTVGGQDVTGTGTHPAPQGLWRSCDGGVTMTIFAGFFEALHFGFGKAAPGKNYPAIYVQGWYSPTGTRATAVFGTWRSIDDPNNGVTSGACNVSTQTWQQLYTPPSDGFSPSQMWTLGWMSGSSDITGDLVTYGNVYMGNNNGFAYGNFP